MKKFFLLITAVLSVVIAAACGSNESETPVSVDSDFQVSGSSSGETSDPGIEYSAQTESRGYFREKGRTYYKGVSVITPQGFEEEESGSMLILTCREEGRSSDNFNFTSSGPDSIDNYNEESIFRILSTVQSIDSLETFERKTVDGYRVLVYSYIIRTEGFDMRQTQCLVFRESDTVAITFTDVTGKYTAVFASALGSLRVEEE